MTALNRREDIRRVTVILAGSRTGSSFLFSGLKAKAEFLAPTGEETPFYRLGGLGQFGGEHFSDAFDPLPDQNVLGKIFSVFSQDLGISLSRCSSPESMAESFFFRFALQWPTAIPVVDQAALKQQLLFDLKALPADWTDWDKTYLDWISRLKTQGYAVSTAPYSAASEYVGFSRLLEEPPYITPHPQTPLTPELAQRCPLLLKTSSNIYRTSFLRALFPKAEFKWIVLQRNPAATVNALMDGWLSGGFHSHDVYPDVRLNIAGYSDVQPEGHRFWKFDMPPGWKEMVRAPLAEVCAFQWLSAYRSIENFRTSTSDSFFNVSYEDLISPRAPEIFQNLIDFSGAAPKKSADWAFDQPVVTVQPPARGKWKKRGAQITELLRHHQNGSLLKLAEKLNYDPKSLEAWP